MSKGNLFLGFARGKVGDVVFSHSHGEQVTRARNRSPRNPQTPLMMLQRVVLKTSSAAFSMTQEITNHSFQGREGVTANQSRFVELNVKNFRRMLATIINSGDDEEILTSSETNYSPKYSSLAAINPYIVSEGSIPSIQQSWNTYGIEAGTMAGVQLTGVMAEIEQNTNICSYSKLIEKLGLQKGDQITIMYLTCDDRTDENTSEFNGFEFGRFICEPNDGDMTHNIYDSQYWNEKTENVNLDVSSGQNVMILPGSTANVQSLMPGKARSYCAGCYIASRLNGGVWQRSSQSLLLRPQTVGTSWHLEWDHQQDFLSDAIESYMADTSSTLYLNQAEV